MLMKKPRHRIFDYPPRFYKPEEDEDERRKKRLGFSKMRKYHQKKKNPIIWIIFIILIVFIIFKLSSGAL